MFQLFVEGGALGMSILTVELIFLFYAAWKAPAWVKEIGLLALITGVGYQLLGCFQAFDYIQQAGEMSMGLIFGGLKVSLISTLYGLIIYAISLIIRIVQKPRIG